MEAGAHPASWWGAEEAGERPERGRRMKTGEQTAGRPASLLGGRRLNPFPSPPSLLLPRPHLSPPLPPPLPRPSSSLLSSLHLPRAPHRLLSSPLVSSASFPSTSSSPTCPLIPNMDSQVVPVNPPFVHTSLLPPLAPMTLHLQREDPCRQRRTRLHRLQAGQGISPLSPLPPTIPHMALQMKCVGAEDGSKCQRCLRSGAECVSHLLLSFSPLYVAFIDPPPFPQVHLREASSWTQARVKVSPL